MGSHVCHRGGLLSGVGRRPCSWCRRLASSGACVSAPMSDRFPDVEPPCSEGPSSVDGSSHPGVARDGILVDRKHVLGAVRCPGGNHPAVLDAQGLRGRWHRKSVWLTGMDVRSETSAGAESPSDARSADLRRDHRPRKIDRPTRSVLENGTSVALRRASAGATRRQRTPDSGDSAASVTKTMCSGASSSRRYRALVGHRPRHARP